MPAPPADVQPQWRAPADGRAQYNVPENVSPTAPRESTRLQVPDLSSQPPPAAPERPAASSLPAGIPSFALAKDRLATGLKPILDGIDWLKENGYRTVLHIRLPGEDDSAERKDFESRGLRYLSLDVSPETLSATTIQEFTRIVSDPAGQPLFVYDKDGSLAGGLWYLYFRMIEKQSPNDALARAKGLGWREGGAEPFARMWLAIQRYLSEQK
jgi:protein tyrosine phosphatase (PTP) superfamily phosphohydrolase (DUF442 family)